MIRSKLCFAAESVSIDAETGQVSAFGLLESIEASVFPVLLQRISLFCLWDRVVADPVQCGVEMSLIVNDAVIAKQILDIDFGQYLRTRTSIRFEGISVAEPGNLIFRLAIPGHDAAQWGVSVKLTPKQDSVSGMDAAGTSGPRYESARVSLSVGKEGLESS